MPCLVALAVPGAELLQVKRAPDVTEPEAVCSLEQECSKMRGQELLALPGALYEETDFCQFLFSTALSALVVGALSDVLYV